MLVLCKDWYAWNNTQPPGPLNFHLVGGIEVGNPGIEVVLTKRNPQGTNPSILLLDMSLYQKPGMWIQVLTCAPARYDDVLPRKQQGYTGVEIFHNGTRIAKIDDVDTVS